MQEIDVRNLVQNATRHLVGIKMLSDKEKNSIKDILLLMQEICSQSGTNCDAKFGNTVFSTLQGWILLNATKFFWSSSCRITNFMVLRLLTSESAGRITGIVNI